MSAQIFVPPCAVTIPTAPLFATGRRLAGVPSGAAPGFATPDNLLALSPPTLLEAYEILAYSLGCVVTLTSSSSFNVGGTPTPPTSAEMTVEFLVNGDTLSSANTPVTAMYQTSSSSTTQYSGNALVAGDLTNPIGVGARDRLGLRLSIIQTQGYDSAILGIGSQFQPTSAGGTFPAYPSTITYRTVALPGSRRL